MRVRSSCCTVSIIGGPVAKQCCAVLVAEHGNDPHADTDVLGFDVDEFGAHARTDIPFDDRQ